MASYVRQHTGSVAFSVALHAAVAAALIIGINFGPRTRPTPQLAIQARVVDEHAMQQEIARLERDKQAEIDRRQQQERQARERAADEKRKREAAEQAKQEQLRIEQEHAAAEKKAREEAAERARQAEEKRKREAEQQRLAEEKREREEAERQRQAAEQARRQKELDAQLQADLASEEERRQAEQAGLLDQYRRLIQNRIHQRWIRPPSARADLQCVVNVTQIPSGDVVAVHVLEDSCNGDDAVRRSIEAAVLRASPLPKPPVPALFERNLVLTFRAEF